MKDKKINLEIHLVQDQQVILNTVQNLIPTNQLIKMEDL